MHECHAEPGDELLAEELAAIRSELSRVDNKSGTLLTLAAAGLALAATGKPQPGVLAGGLLVAGLLIAGTAMLQLLFVVRPRLGGPWSRRLAGERPEEMSAELRAWRYSELAALSHVVLTKYRMMRIAASLLMCALPLIVGVQLAVLLR